MKNRSGDKLPLQFSRSLCRKIIPLMLVFALLFTLSACSDEGSGVFPTMPAEESFVFPNVTPAVTPTETPTGVMPIKRFSQFSGIIPSSVTSNSGIEVYNNNVSVSSLGSYAEYLASRGYTENKELQKKYAADYDYLRVFEGGSTSQFVNITFSMGVGTIGYGADCVFDNGGSNGGSTPDRSNPTPGIICRICGGTGKVVCSSCKGAGYITTIEYAPDYGFGTKSYEVKHTCKACQGSKQMTCTGCWGKGVVNG